MSDADDLVHKVIDVGKKYYRTAEFKKACSMFTKAIVLNESFSESQLENIRLQYGLAKKPNHDHSRIWHPLLCQALDFRSLCYEKLKKYNESFKDGKAMINYEPYNMKGYIRCGKLYETSLEKPQRALKYYELGLRKAELGESSFKIKPNKKLTQYLQQRVQKLKPMVPPASILPASRIMDSETLPKMKRKIEEPLDLVETSLLKTQKLQEQREVIDLREFDILNVLPVEIMNQIMRHITCKDVLNCMGLNRLWSQYIHCYSAPLLQNVYIRNLTDLKGFDKFLGKCSKFGDPIIIEKLHFNSSKLLGQKVLSMLFDILLSKTSIVRELAIIAYDLNLAVLTNYMEQNLTWCSHLQKITVICQFLPIVELEHRLLKMCDNLQSLEILYTEVSTSMSSHAIRDHNTNNKGKYTLEQHLSLRYLTIANLVYRKNRIPLVILPKCPALKELTLFGMKLSTDYFEGLNEKFPHIESLKLEKLKDFSLLSFLQIFSQNKMQFRLKKLTIREDKLILMPLLPINQAQRMTLAENFSDLRELDLYSSSITFHNLYKLIEQCFKLESLNIGNCPNLVFDNAGQDIITQIFDQLRNATNLKKLLVPQLIGINSIIFETLVIKQISMLPELQMLDISFNEEINGVNLWSLVRTLNNPNLILLCNGCSKIGPTTISQIQNTESTPLVRKIIYEYTLQQWTRYVLRNYYN